jgi:hypothetical protein
MEPRLSQPGALAINFTPLFVDVDVVVVVVVVKILI